MKMRSSAARTLAAGGPIASAQPDEEHVRELFTELWGERLTPNKIDLICKELIADGLDTYEQWPLGWCAEEDDDKEEQAWRLQDYEEELKEQAEKTQKRPTSPTP